MIRLSLVPTTIPFGTAVVLDCDHLTPSLLYTFKSVIKALLRNALGRASELARDRGLLLSICARNERDSLADAVILSRVFESVCSASNIRYAVSLMIIDSDAITIPPINASEIVVARSQTSTPFVPYVSVTDILSKTKKLDSVLSRSLVVSAMSNIEDLVSAIDFLKRVSIGVIVNEFEDRLRRMYESLKRRGIDAELPSHCVVHVREALFSIRCI